MKRTLESQKSVFVGNKVDDKCIICIACWKNKYAFQHSQSVGVRWYGACMKNEKFSSPTQATSLPLELQNDTISSRSLKQSTTFRTLHLLPCLPSDEAVAAFNAAAMFALTASRTIVLITLRFVPVLLLIIRIAGESLNEINLSFKN